MNTISNDIHGRLLRLKENFDRTIAQPIEVKPRDRTKYLVFRLKEEFFAWPAANLKEIVFDLPIVALPGRLDRFYGIVNYKNNVLPVVNLHHHLNLASEKSEKSHILLITKALAADSALLVDGLILVAPVANDRIRPKPISIEAETAHMICGEFYHKEQMVTILNPEAFCG
jgi:chemotaxis signal transduction protein